MKVAVQGCAHGELENIYNTIEHIEKQNNITIDLLLCCGDFQATRNLDDLKSMAVPPKFRSLCTFYKYYSGEKLAPKLTVFIGGNHEASNYLQELPYGGWVAPNIYYLGYAGVINIGGIRIAGLSGIFKGWDYPKGRFEKPPYNEDSLRSCYHIRNLDIFRLKQLSLPLHIMLSHDWPAGITNHGNVKSLLKEKPFLKEDIENESLGSKPAAELLECLKPDYWFAAHLHVKFSALVKHSNGSDPKITRFLSLDKCLPRRKFLQILDIPHDPECDFQLKYDLEWLTILFLTNSLLSISKLNNYMPGPGSNQRWDFKPTKEELDLVMEKFQNDLNVPKNFTPTAPSHNSESNSLGETGKQPRLNPQTVEFCAKLSIDDPMTLLLNEDGFHNVSTTNLSSFESSSFIGDSDAETASPSTSQRVSRTPLILPRPSVQISDDKCEETLSTHSQKAPSECETPKNTIPDDETHNSEERAEESDGSIRKKFKRRNMALYASTDDD